MNAQCEIEPYKVWLVAKGYKQKDEIDYAKVFALVTRMKIVWQLIFLAAQHKWLIFQMDVK